MPACKVHRHPAYYRHASGTAELQGISGPAVADRIPDVLNHFLESVFPPLGIGGAPSFENIGNVRQAAGSFFDPGVRQETKKADTLFGLFHGEPRCQTSNSVRTVQMIRAAFLQPLK